MSSEDRHGARAEAAGDDFETLALDELVALADALDLRVRCGTATLVDFGALARARRALVWRAEAGRWARSRDGGGPV